MLWRKAIIETRPNTRTVAAMVFLLEKIDLSVPKSVCPAMIPDTRSNKDMKTGLRIVLTNVRTKRGNKETMTRMARRIH